MRADRRKYDEYREISLTKGLCMSSQGSARLKFGPTEVIANVNGPKECRYREVDTGLTQVHVKTFPEKHELNDIIVTAISNALDLSAYPDSYIEISITIICDDGSLASCAINAAILALHDAHLKLTRKVSASCFTFKGKELYIDPTRHEEEVADGVVTFAYSHEDQRVFSCFFEGNIDPAMMVAATSRATYNKEIMLPFFD
ncbi:3' exoribonuclease family, domain 1 containing protein [Tritrichomonas foetus]|uniref:3' exoribonuclease family, domain 1 containing protein n=1 Tax=Tritrichomonas foetus TaxID=1144522 RepID=A0A1J4JJU1_9EUKA|nr:3' exoribonuclease family, domain 1 containing protein [Tritrichomonas foetus]|eukprot:OHS97821.1 3' exoribonuclease family, domain 1 containing protein [Tritrichomonas foetus]